jgi:hypothetical protein
MLNIISLLVLESVEESQGQKGSAAENGPEKVV